MKIASLPVLLLGFLASNALASAAPQLGKQTLSPQYYTLPPLREQAELQDSWTQQRRDQIPALLQKYGVDAWLVRSRHLPSPDPSTNSDAQISQREYAEETVFWSLKRAEQFSARRRTTLLFLANATAGAPSSYTWIDNTPGVWAELAAVLEAQQPRSIAVDRHRELAFASGLHAGELEALEAGLGQKWAARLVNEPMLAIEFVATMPEGRLAWYRRLQETAWTMIGEAFSEAVVTPGRTTTGDVEWWLREKVQAMNYSTWFQPSVSIMDPTFRVPGDHEPAREVIAYGDMLHVDFGVTALGMNTDTQHLGYVLRPGEEDVPEGLKTGLRKGNRMQDIVRGKMRTGLGKTGNEVLAECLAQMTEEGIQGLVYSHAIGDWGHSAGTVIGKP